MLGCVLCGAWCIAFNLQGGFVGRLSDSAFGCFLEPSCSSCLSQKVLFSISPFWKRTLEKVSGCSDWSIDAQFILQHSSPHFYFAVLHRTVYVYLWSCSQLWLCDPTATLKAQSNCSPSVHAKCLRFTVRSSLQAAFASLEHFNSQRPFACPLIWASAKCLNRWKMNFGCSRVPSCRAEA